MGAYGNVALGRGGILKRNILGQSVSFVSGHPESVWHLIGRAH